MLLSEDVLERIPDYSALEEWSNAPPSSFLERTYMKESLKEAFQELRKADKDRRGKIAFNHTQITSDDDRRSSPYVVADVQDDLSSIADQSEVQSPDICSSNSSGGVPVMLPTRLRRHSSAQIVEPTPIITTTSFSVVQEPTPATMVQHASDTPCIIEIPEDLFDPPEELNGTPNEGATLEDPVSARPIRATSAIVAAIRWLLVHILAFPSQSRNMFNLSGKTIANIGWMVVCATMSISFIALAPAFRDQETSDQALRLAKWTAKKDFKEACKDLVSSTIVIGVLKLTSLR